MKGIFATNPSPSKHYSIRRSTLPSKEYLDELLVMASLKHKNVVRFIGGCVDPPDLFFVMERCECSLHRVIHGSKSENVAPEKLSLADKLTACRDVAEGMAYLHSKASDPP